jgi:hypothetical protein
MNNVIHFSPRCSKCGAWLGAALTLCSCFIEHDAAHIREMPIRPQIITPIVTQTSTGSWDSQFHRYVISKR